MNFLSDLPALRCFVWAFRLVGRLQEPVEAALVDSPQPHLELGAAFCQPWTEGWASCLSELWQPETERNRKAQHAFSIQLQCTAFPSNWINLIPLLPAEWAFRKYCPEPSLDLVRHVLQRAWGW